VAEAIGVTQYHGRSDRVVLDQLPYVQVDITTCRLVAKARSSSTLAKSFLELDAGPSLFSRPESECPFTVRFNITMEIVSPYFSPEEYLERAYAHQKEIGGIYIPFYDILGKLFKDLILSDEAATRISSFVFSNDDFLSVYSGVITSIIAAAQQLSEANDLGKLANLVLTLSRLPDIRNESSKTLYLSFNLENYEVAPGQVFKVDDGKIWSELPGFATDLGDSMRGICSLFLTVCRYLISLAQVLQPTSMTAHPNT
jgi:hypothetical protein